jgi:hypothetical protein
MLTIILAAIAAIQIAIINQSAVLTDAEIQAIVPALQTQVTEDFAPHWGVDADVFFSAPDSVPPGAWRLTLYDLDPVYGRAGRGAGCHGVGDDGVPLATIVALPLIENGQSWSKVVSHELLEMLGNPYRDKFITYKGSTYRLENADPVQSSRHAYEIYGVLVSDFVFPEWFVAGKYPKGTTFDFRGYTRKPFQTARFGNTPNGSTGTCGPQ